MNEVGKVEGVFGELVFSQLALVEIIDKQTDSAMKSVGARRETSGRTCQTSYIVPKFSIVAFDGVGVGLAFRNGIATPVTPQGSIHLETIAVIPSGFGCMVNNGLDKFL